MKNSRPKPYTAGQCLDDVVRALKRFYKQGFATKNEELAIIDAALRMRSVKPAQLRTPGGCE